MEKETLVTLNIRKVKESTARKIRVMAAQADLTLGEMLDKIVSAAK